MSTAETPNVFILQESSRSMLLIFHVSAVTELTHNKHAIFILPFQEWFRLYFSSPFINSCTPLNDVGYARTCVGESLNELLPHHHHQHQHRCRRPPHPLPPLPRPPPSSVPSTSYYGISIKSLRLMGEPGLYGKRLWEKRDDGGVCAPWRQRGTDFRAHSLVLAKTARLEIGQTYFYSEEPLPHRELWLR